MAGKRHINSGNYEEAIDCFDKALELYPNFAEAYNNKDLALAKLGMNNEAIVCYEMAIQYNPNFV